MHSVKNFIFFFSTILFHSLLQSGPYQFRRIIVLNENKEIIKTIDLASDIHAPEEVKEIVKKPSRKHKPLLTLDEKSAFTSSERTLLITLRKLAKEKNLIELLWEETAYQPEELLVPNELSWITYGGWQLKKEFAPENKLSVIYKNADTYRKPSDVSNYVILLDPGALPDSRFKIRPDLGQIKLATIVSYIEKLIDTKESPILKDLQKVLNNQFNDAHTHLLQISTNFIKTVLIPLYSFLKEELSQNPSMTVLEARSLIKKSPERRTKFRHLINNFYRITDIDILIKLFSSLNDHAIVYAGGNHCDQVAQALLEMKKNYTKEIINIGTTADQAKRTYPVLNPKAWLFMQETPQQSYTRFKQRGHPIINLADKNIWDEFFALQAQMGKAFEDDDAEIEHLLTTFYSKASKTYIDFINTRDHQMNTLLIPAVINNLQQTVRFLIKHGARINVQNDQGDTPLHLAQSAEIAQILLEHGAKTDIKNQSQLTAAELAKKDQRKAVEQTIKKFEEEKLKKKKKNETQSESQSFEESKQEIPEYLDVSASQNGIH